MYLENSPKTTDDVKEGCYCEFRQFQLAYCLRINTPDDHFLWLLSRGSPPIGELRPEGTKRVDGQSQSCM